jgi:hypothetical protein
MGEWDELMNDARRLNADWLEHQERPALGAPDLHHLHGAKTQDAGGERFQIFVTMRTDGDFLLFGAGLHKFHGCLFFRC